MFRYISNWLRATGRVFAREWQLAIHDAGVLIFFILLPLAYPVVYTLVYNPEVVRDMPVAVVDNDRTASSRELVRVAGATPAIHIYDYASDMAEAKRMMASGDVCAILEIPSGYGRALGRGTQAHAQMYVEMSLLLRYRNLQSAMADIQMEMATRITTRRIDALGAESLAAGGGLPVSSESNFLGDTEQGFASFVMPGIVVLILQQSMLLGICMLGGTSRERRRRNNGVDPRQITGVPVSATVWGKALCYVVFYIPVTIYILHFIPEWFHLPHYGNPVDYLLFIFPMLLASAFLGLSLNWVMKEREDPFLVIVFSSVVFLFLSGLTWPRYSMNPLWTWLGNLVPGVWGVEGFIRINSNAATLGECSRAYIALWILTAVYLITAWLVTRHIARKDRHYIQ